MSFLAPLAGPLISGGLGLIGGHQAGTAAKRTAAMAGPQSYNTSGPFGSVNFDRNTGRTTFDMADNPFATLSNNLSGQFLQGISADPMQQFPPWLMGAGMEGMDEMAALGGRAADAAGGFYDSLQTSPDAMAADRYRLLTEQARPGEERMFNQLQAKLHAQGRLGTTVGANNMRALFEAQSGADLGRQMAAQDLGLTTQRQLASLASGMSGDAASRAAGRFDMARTLLGTGSDATSARIGQANQLQNGYQSIFQNLMQQAQLAQGMAGGNPDGAAITHRADRERNNALVGMFGPLGEMLGDKIAERWGGGPGADGLGIDLGALASRRF